MNMCNCLIMYKSLTHLIRHYSNWYMLEINADYNCVKLTLKISINDILFFQRIALGCLIVSPVLQACVYNVKTGIIHPSISPGAVAEVYTFYDSNSVSSSPSNHCAILKVFVTVRSSNIIFTWNMFSVKWK